MIGKEKERGDLFMNKNLKRALNTTAAVSMSLAMVLGAVAPVTNIAAATAADTVDSAVANKSQVVKVLNMLGDVTVIALNDELGKFPTATDSDVEKEYDFKTLVAEYKDLFEEAYKFASVVDYTEEQTEALEYLVGTEIGGNKGTVVDWAEKLVATETVEYLEKYDGKVDANVVKKYNEISALMAYKGNVDTTKLATLEKVEDKFADLEVDVKDYKEDNVSKDAKAFAEALEKETVTAGLTVDALVNDEKAIPYTSLTTVENFIKKITKDSYKLADVKYGDVKEEDVVAELVEGLEAIAEGMKEAKELIADTKDEKRAFDKLSAKIKALADVAKTGEDNDAQLDKIDEAIAAFRSEDVKTLKTYVDTVVNEFWTVAVDQRTSGSYRVKEVDAGLGRYYAFDKVAGENLRKLMTTLVERDGEDTYYDLLVADAASVDELLKAVTTDIEGMTMNSVMTNQQAAKIIAAKKALTKLDADNQKIYKTLTRAERAEVDANREMIEVLYVKLLLNGEVTTIGWVETAKGWEYYDNNGKRVYEGWAPGNGYWSFMKNGYSVSNEWCAAKEGWYYMGADGKMVTGKVVIDGVEQDFGTDGIWVRNLD